MPKNFILGVLFAFMVAILGSIAVGVCVANGLYGWAAGVACFLILLALSSIANHVYAFRLEFRQEARL